jgi:hypothetical protein
VVKTRKQVRWPELVSYPYRSWPYGEFVLPPWASISSSDIWEEYDTDLIRLIWELSELINEAPRTAFGRK